MIKLYTSLIIALIMLAGCSSDDDGPSGPQVSSDLFGEWTLQFIDDGNGVEDPTCAERLYYKFNSDNTYEKKYSLSMLRIIALKRPHLAEHGKPYQNNL
jgi:hypothetical protein